MQDRPDGGALLDQARRTLLDDLLPHLPEPHRYTGLMVANAMAIAGRELAAARGAGDDHVRQARIGLVTDLRQGAKDGDRGLFETLLRDAKDRVSVSNPKRLE